MKTKTIDIPIFFGEITIIKTDSFKEVNEKYNTEARDDIYEAVVFELKDQDHHMVNAIFLRCVIELDRNNDEPQAYLTGWVINEIDVFLNEI